MGRGGQWRGLLMKGTNKLKGHMEINWYISIHTDAFGNQKRINVSEHAVNITYIHPILIDKDFSESRNVSIKFPWVHLVCVCLLSGDHLIFSISFPSPTSPPYFCISFPRKTHSTSFKMFVGLLHTLLPKIMYRQFLFR